MDVQSADAEEVRGEVAHRTVAEAGLRRRGAAQDVGQRLGVNGTPAFFINGVALGGAQPLEKFKEVIDTYYFGKVLAVSVVAGLIRLRVPGPGVNGSFSAGYWSRYPDLARLWNTSVENPTAKPSKQTKPADEFVDLDLELDFGEDDDDYDASESQASSSTACMSDSGLLGVADLPEPSASN